MDPRQEEMSAGTMVERPHHVIGICVRYSDGEDLWVDTKGVTALAWGHGPDAGLSSDHVHNPENHIPRAPNVPTPQPTSYSTEAVIPSSETVSEGIDAGVCYWDGKQWVC